MIESELLNGVEGIRYGFFTREGGVSEGLYASLNCGLGSADDGDRVRENRARVARWLGAKPDRLLTARQVHSPAALIAEEPWPAGALPEGDAIVTRTPGLAVGALSADCAPLLFADPAAKVVAAAHAGWRGARDGVIEATLDAMERLGARRERTLVVVGPSISRTAYEVGDAFREDFMARDPANARFFAEPDEGGRPYFDLPGYCLHRLQRAGVTACVDLAQCTYASESLFFSYRRATHAREPDYGRQISAILIL
jgi:hypothetical protein